jgi:prepilin-type N-terminal cleavage/methylation domain-containing protein
MRILGDHVGMRRKGFTLIELLVVVAIIVILAAILYPVFAATRRAANNAACLSNMKQIGLAVQMYAQDYDESFPVACCQSDRVLGKAQPDLATLGRETPYLWEVVTPYIKNAGLWRCPGDVGYYSMTRSGNIVYDFRPNAFAKTGSSYTYNTDLVWLRTDGLDVDPFERNGQWAPMTISQVQKPTETWVAAEPTGYWHNAIQAPPPPQRNAGNDTRDSTYRQNMVCVDGHAKAVGYTQAKVIGSRERTEF